MDNKIDRLASLNTACMYVCSSGHKHSAQDCWGFGLCQLSGILKARKHWTNTGDGQSRKPSSSGLYRTISNPLVYSELCQFLR
jgi:hypothetical protein